VLKDLGYVLELAAQTELTAHVAELARRYYAAAASGGFSGRYFPSVIELIDRGDGPTAAQSDVAVTAAPGQPDASTQRSRAHG